MSKKIPYKEIYGYNRLSYYPSDKHYVHNSDNAIVEDDEDEL